MENWHFLFSEMMCRNVVLMFRWVVVVRLFVGSIPYSIWKMGVGGRVGR
jgi:hypothetical protein